MSQKTLRCGVWRLAVVPDINGWSLVWQRWLHDLKTRTKTLEQVDSSDTSIYPDLETAHKAKAQVPEARPEEIKK